MGLKYRVNAAAPRVRALIEKAEAMDRDIHCSNTDVLNSIIGGLITIVSDLEAAQHPPRPTGGISADRSAKLSATAEELAFRSAESGL